MRGLGKIVTHLNAVRSATHATHSGDGPLEALTDFGTNPGGLDCRVYLPASSPTALVLVLHGCTQSASAYDRGSGWSQLAERHGFALVFPQQRHANNSNLCFNWYAPAHARRGHGEAKSISEMVQSMAARYGLGRSRIFVTGLSAGGAMTSVMLACYPELFASGAIIAGLPFATADTLSEALERMRGQGFPNRRELAVRARSAASFDGSPSTLSVWHGTNDAIVHPANSGAIVDQWLDMHGLGGTAGRVEKISGHRHETWTDARGRVCVERYDIRGMGHGTPLDTTDGAACGVAGPHMLEANICSTSVIAASWGLLRSEADSEASLPGTRAPAGPIDTQWAPPRIGRTAGVGAIIEDALRSAGLMR